MFTTVPMELISVVMLREQAEEAVSRLVKLGIFQPVDIRGLEDELGGLQPFHIEKESMELDIAGKRLRDIAEKGGWTLPPSRDVHSHTFESISSILERAESLVAPDAEEKERLTEEMRTLESALSGAQEAFPLGFGKGAGHTYLQLYYGTIDSKNVSLLEKSLKGIPFVFYPAVPAGKRPGEARVPAMLVGLKRDRDILEKVLRDLAWENRELGTEDRTLPKEVRDRMLAQIAELKEKVRAAGERLRQTGRDLAPELASIQAFISMKRNILEAKRYSFTTDKTALISGWVPAPEKARAVEEIQKVARAAYIEEKKAEDVRIPAEDVPVQLKHNPFLRPFELLIDAYGIPRYGSIDPTIFVATSFLLMFGIMFGDIGHGLALFVLGLLLRRSPSGQFRQASLLLIYCGISSTLFGLVEGSFFGHEFNAVWFKPMEEIPRLFRVCVRFGIAYITLGIILNIFNSLRDKNFRKAFFDKAGLVAGVVYWAGIAVVTKMFVLKAPVPPVYMFLFAAGILVLFLKPMVEYALKKRHESFPMVLMESFIETFEFMTSYLANTVSFIRIGAFALAHAGLFMAIFELSKLLKGVGGGVFSYLVIILGNIIVILLEGMIVSIQSLRLNYYEFFSKFFVSGKRLYKPLTL